MSAEHEPVTVQQVACMRNGLIYTLPRPARHGNVMHLARINGFNVPFAMDEQGFLLSDGTFADRALAYSVAKAAEQPWLRPPEVDAGEHLFTEDLW